MIWDPWDFQQHLTFGEMDTETIPDHVRDMVQHDGYLLVRELKKLTSFLGKPFPLKSRVVKFKEVLES